MEGNELEKAADNKQPDWKSLCNRLNAELTRANARIKELDDKYLKLSQQYDDLYRKHKPL